MFMFQIRYYWLAHKKSQRNHNESFEKDSKNYETQTGVLKFQFKVSFLYSYSKIGNSRDKKA